MLRSWVTKHDRDQNPSIIHSQWEARQRRLSRSRPHLIRLWVGGAVQVRPDADRRWRTLRTSPTFTPQQLSDARRGELKNLRIEMCLGEDNRRGDKKCVNERRWFMSSRQTNCCDNSGGQIEPETDNRPDKAFSSGWNGESKLRSFCTICSFLLFVFSSQSVISLV